MTRVFLRPQIVVGGTRAMSDDELHELHNEAHERCFIANSVRSEVLIAPAIVGLA
jgi:organic hydroperoxide reductase OsmC/OhrA